MNCKLHDRVSLLSGPGQRPIGNSEHVSSRDILHCPQHENGLDIRVSMRDNESDPLGLWLCSIDDDN